MLVLLGDQISGEIPLPRGSGGWKEQLTEIAWNVRGGLLAQRDAARVLAITPPFGPRRLRHIEAVLRVLRLAGFSRKDAARAAYHANNFVTEFLADETRFAAFADAAGSNRRKVFAQRAKPSRRCRVKSIQLSWSWRTF